MADASNETDVTTQNAGVKDWLFNPFVYEAGGGSLLIGLAAILLAGYVGALSNMRFDGVLDMHTSAPAPTWKFLAEGIINWLVLALVLYIVGRIISKSAFRAIDLFGTQALARWPTLIAAPIGFAPQLLRATAAILQMAQNPSAGLQIAVMDLVVFALLMIIILLVMVLMVALMYRSFSLCCNVKGVKSAVVFILGLIIAEVISKVIVVRMQI